jgi:hypothetical protein
MATAMRAAQWAAFMVVAGVGERPALLSRKGWRHKLPAFCLLALIQL